MQRRASIFAPSGTFIREFALPIAQGVPLRWDRLTDGRLVQQTRMVPGRSVDSAPETSSGVILVRSSGGEIRDTIVILPSSETFTMAGATPRLQVFAAEPLWAVTSGNRVAVAMNDRYRIELYSESGILHTVITRAFESAKVTLADQQMLKERASELMVKQGLPPEIVARLLSGMEFAERYPVLSDMIGGPEGTLWIQRVKNVEEFDMTARGADAFDFGAPLWDVYDIDGRLLGQVALPEKFRPFRIKGDLIYGVQRDDIDAHHAARLMIRRSGR